MIDKGLGVYKSLSLAFKIFGTPEISTWSAVDNLKIAHNNLEIEKVIVPEFNFPVKLNGRLDHQTFEKHKFKKPNKLIIPLGEPKAENLIQW